MAWINPNSVTANGWTDSENAIDGSTATSASHPGSGRNTWSPWLTAHLTSAKDCDQVRVYASRQNSQVSSMQIEVYYDSAWNLVYDGNAVESVYVTEALGATYSVTDMRVRFYMTQADRTAYVHVMQFNEIPAATNATVTSPIATATAEGLVPTVTATSDASIIVPIATSDATGLATTVTANQQVTVIIPLSTADSEALAPSVLTAVNVTILTPVATSDAQALVPLVSAQENVTVSVPVAEGDAEGLTPVISTQESTSVSVVLATGEAEALAPSIVTAVNVTVPAVTAEATATGLAPQVTVGGEVITYAQYRKDGAALWIDTPQQVVSESGNFSEILEGLDDDTSYEYRGVVEWEDESGPRQKFGEIITFHTGVGVIPVTVYPPVATAEAIGYSPIIYEQATTTIQVPLVSLTATAFEVSGVSGDANIELPSLGGEINASGVGETPINESLYEIPGIHFEALAPTYVSHATAEPEIAEMVGQALSPSVEGEVNVTINPPLVSAEASAFVPTVSYVANVTILVPISTLELHSTPPLLEVVGNITIIVPLVEAEGQPLVSTITAAFHGRFYSVEVPEEFYFVDIKEDFYFVDEPQIFIAGEISQEFYSMDVQEEFYFKEVKEEFEVKDVSQEFFFREVDK